MVVTLLKKRLWPPRLAIRIYLSGNFAPIKSCLPLTPCSYEGTIPPDLAGGQYVRNGGNPVTNDDQSRAAHWFDGDGMLSGVLFRCVGEKKTDIQPEFVNQYLLTDVYCHAKSNKYLRRPVVPSIATLVNPAVSMIRIMFEVFRTVLLVMISRLPGVDPVTKELITFHATFVKPFVRCSVVPPTSKSTIGRQPLFDAPVPGVESPKMMHDFGVSRHHTVIMDLPLSLDTMNLLRGVPSLSYNSAGKSRFGVFPRYKPQAVQWFETNPCTIFHTANCWDTPNPHAETNGTRVSVNLVACRLTSAAMVFSAGNLPTPEVKPVPPEYAEEEQCRLYYYNFPLSDIPGVQYNIRHQWALSAISLEFPSVAPAYSMQEARYVYGCSTGEASYTVALGKAAKIDHLAKFDIRTLVARGLANPRNPSKDVSTHGVLPRFGTAKTRKTQSSSSECPMDGMPKSHVSYLAQSIGLRTMGGC
ncbi:retinal pigment epithelial membrane protein [Colletotrichum higginsianum]|nr:retinal pigment epithelial membrane protein [Colletotrichum higginsianum]